MKDGNHIAPADQVLHLDFVSVPDITVDASYQRKISDRGRVRINKIVKEFDWRRFGALVLARNSEGGLNVIDGQHRLLAAVQLGLATVPAVIASGDLVDQAKAFVAVNADRTGVVSIDKFRARVVAGDGTAVTVHKMLKTLGINCDIAAGCAIRPRETRAVSLLEKLVKRAGEGVVFTTLETLIDAQPEQPNLLTAFVIEATAIVVAQMIDAGRDLERLDRVLADTDFETLKEEAAQLSKLTGGRLAQRGGELLMQRVNKRQRGQQ